MFHVKHFTLDMKGPVDVLTRQYNTENVPRETFCMRHDMTLLMFACRDYTEIVSRETLSQKQEMCYCYLMCWYNVNCFT